MFQIAVCDDDEQICKEIVRVLETESFDHCNGIEVQCYHSGENLCVAMEAQYFDLLILDIELKRMDGIQVARFLRNYLHNYRTLILYISAKQQYCMELFESMPLQFLVKPLRTDEIVRLVQKAICLKQEGECAFQFKKSGRNCRVLYKEILYFESRDKQVRLKTEQEEYSFYRKLDEVEKEVADGNFIRIHKSYLVNYHHIRSYGMEQIWLSNGEALSVSRTYQQTAMNKILQYARRHV